MSSHKIAGAEETIRQTGASLGYLPPYSPALNPIEMAFSKLKALIRKQNARSFPELFNAVTDASRSFPSTHCTGFFRHANYATD
ncbi:MAG: transposase [Opitutales bacterium]